MDALLEANKAWREQFLKERLRFVGTNSPFFVEFLEKGEIVHLFYDNAGAYQSDWDIHVSFKGKVLEFVCRESENFFFQQEDDFKNDEEIDDFYAFLKRMDIRHYLVKNKTQAYERGLLGRKNHEGLSIQSVEKDKNEKYFIYTLSSGEKLYLPAWRS